jgi:hypothetical protein
MNNDNLDNAPHSPIFPSTTAAYELKPHPQKDYVLETHSQEDSVPKPHSQEYPISLFFVDRFQLSRNPDPGRNPKPRQESFF